MRALLATFAAALAISACGSPTGPRTQGGTPDGSRTIGIGDPWGRGVRIAALGDSLTAGTPGYDPDAGGDPRSQYEWRLVERLGAVSVRNCGVNRERVDQIADRYAACAEGADVVIVQGGINDIAQGRSTRRALDGLLELARRSAADGHRTAVVELLPWNNGGPVANREIERFNAGLRRRLTADRSALIVPWHRVLRDPSTGRMRTTLTVDGDHPSPAGYARLGDATAAAIGPMVRSVDEP